MRTGVDLWGEMSPVENVPTPETPKMLLIHRVEGKVIQIWPTSTIFKKSRLLVGPEAEMLASHWSRDPFENF